MKQYALAIAALVVMSTPAYADTAQTPKKLDVIAPAQFMSFKTLDEMTRQYRLDEKVSFKVNDYLAIGRVPLAPFQTYAGSTTYSRRMVGIQVSFRF
jgi:hypothetical protein